MAKTNYPEELTNLVEEYLTDGIISAKERQVLLNKAEKLGVDVDEFDLYIDAQQQKVDQVTDTAVRKTKGKACPYCGKPVPQLAEQCPHCGQFITAEASKELEEILNKLEDALVDFKARRDIDHNKAVVEKYSRKARMYYSSHPKIKAILAEVDMEISAVESAAKRQALIKGTIKNKWFWCAVPIVMGLFFLLIALAIADPYKELGGGASEVLGFIGFFAIMGGVYGLIGAGDNRDKER